MGDKVKAKAIMAAAGVPVLPSATIPAAGTGDLAAAAAGVGFPLLVKAAVRRRRPRHAAGDRTRGS